MRIGRFTRRFVRRPYRVIAIVTAVLAMIGLAFAGGKPAQVSTSASSATLSGLARSAVAQAQAATPVSPVNPG